MLISKEHIQNLIPQRPPFVMIDNLLEATDEFFVSDFTILPDNIFIEDGVLREFAMIENIAQSSSAGLAATTKRIGDKRPEGYLGAISKLKLFELPQVNDRIYTKVKLLAQFDNMYLLKGENYVNNTKLMECELKLVAVPTSL
jgi:3-hydroxymyristoyl/3-hydroxydecanoyl-(acyl carrier protein) dehydratase